MLSQTEKNENSAPVSPVAGDDKPDPGYNPYQYYPGIAPDPNSKYVFNGATFVPIQAGMGRESSYLNTDDGGGLTPEGKYRYNFIFISCSSNAFCIIFFDWLFYLIFLARFNNLVITAYSLFDSLRGGSK